MRIGIREQLAAAVLLCATIPLAVLAISVWYVIPGRRVEVQNQVYGSDSLSLLLTVVFTNSNRIFNDDFVVAVTGNELTLTGMWNRMCRAL